MSSLRSRDQCHGAAYPHRPSPIQPQAIGWRQALRHRECHLLAGPLTDDLSSSETMRAPLRR
jgi:hypothetical protein